MAMEGLGIDVWMGVEGVLGAWRRWVVMWGVVGIWLVRRWGKV